MVLIYSDSTQKRDAMTTEITKIAKIAKTATIPAIKKIVSESLTSVSSDNKRRRVTLTSVGDKRRSRRRTFK